MLLEDSFEWAGCRALQMVWKEQVRFIFYLMKIRFRIMD